MLLKRKKKAAYRKLMLKIHPDLYTKQEEKKKAEEIAKKVNDLKDKYGL